MLAQLNPYRNCAVLPWKEEGRSHSTMLWMHYGRWTPVRQKPAVVTTEWSASVVFSAAAAARAAVANLSYNKDVWALIGLERTREDVFAVACGLSLLFLFASFWQSDDSGGWA